jgi:hypothetical protein
MEVLDQGFRRPLAPGIGDQVIQFRLRRPARPIESRVAFHLSYPDWEASLPCQVPPRKS